MNRYLTPWLSYLVLTTALTTPLFTTSAQQIDQVHTAAGAWIVTSPFITRYENGNLLMIVRSGNDIDVDGPDIEGSGGELPFVTIDGQFMVLYAPDGSIIWTKRLYSNTAIVIRDHFADDDMNAYIVGSMLVDIDLDGPDITGLGGEMTFTDLTLDDSNGFFAKYDHGGNLIWARQFGGTSDDSAISGTVDSDGNVILVGVFEDTGDFDGPNASTPNTRITSASPFFEGFLAKYSGDGEFMWVRQTNVDSESAAKFKVVDTDDAGNIYTCVEVSGSADLDGPTVTGAGGEFGESSGVDLILAKYDPAGTLLSAKATSGDGLEVCEQLLLDHNQNIIVSGFFVGSGDFDGSQGSGLGGEVESNGEEDLFVAKYDSEGTFDWVRTVGGDMSEFSRFTLSAPLAVDAGGNVYLGGTSPSSLDFDGPDITGQGGESVSFDERDAIIVKYKPNGDFVWIIRHEDVDEGLIVGLDVGSDNSLYAIGEYEDNVDFDGAAISGFGGEVVNPHGRWMVAGARYAQDPVSANTDSPAFDADFVLRPVYPNPAFESVTIRYETSDNASVRIRLFDILGRTTVDITKGFLPAGDHEDVIDVRELPEGVYFFRVESRESMSSGSFVVTR